MKMKTKYAAVPFLLILLSCLFCLSAAAAGESGFNAGLDVDRTNEAAGSFTVTVADSAVLAEKKPLLRLPCSYTTALVIAPDSSVQIGAIADGQVSFRVAMGGTYTVMVSDAVPSAGFVITFDANGGTTPAASMTTEADGTLSSLPVPSRSGMWIFSGWYAPGSSAPITADTVFTKDTTVYAQWTLDLSILPTNQSYPPVIAETEGGEVQLSIQSPHMGDTVVITPVPAEGYEVDTVIIKDMSGRVLAVTPNGDGSFRYVQPFGRVTVTAAFRALPPDASARFIDLEPEQWYSEAVDYVIAHDLMNGVSDDRFDPAGTLSRGQFVTILWRLAGEPLVSDPMPFEDVESDSWYTEAIRWAASKRIVSSGTAFRPGDPITREEMAVVLYRYEQSRGGGFTGMWMYSMGFSDLAEVSDWAFEALAWCNMNGIITGEPGNLLNPKGLTERAEAAAVIMRFMERMDG